MYWKLVIYIDLLACGAFPNAICYSDLENVTGIIGIDWNKDLLSLASEMNSLNKARFELMNSTDIEYKDNSFDTVVDTFGLQASLYPKKQLDEMIRVCKKGGKILLLEIGESYWNSTNYKLIRNGFQNFTTRGEILFRNWDEIIENYNNLKLVKIVEKKRRINGILYYYELEKI